MQGTEVQFLILVINSTIKKIIKSDESVVWIAFISSVVSIEWYCDVFLLGCSLAIGISLLFRFGIFDFAFVCFCMLSCMYVPLRLSIDSHIAQNVRWTSILGPKIQLTSTSWPDLKWTSIGCPFREEKGMFTWEYEMDLKWTSTGCPFLDEEWTYSAYEINLKWTSTGCPFGDEEWTWT